MQPAIQHLFASAFKDLSGLGYAIEQCRQVGGGSINETYQVTTRDGRHLFCKMNDSRRYPGMLQAERQGLALLASQDIFRIPATVACILMEDRQFLFLEWIDQGLRTNAFWERFGAQLARLHRITAPSFGLDHDNYMGALPQENHFCSPWSDFFRDRRLRPQVRLAASKGMLPADAEPHFERLYDRLPELFPPEPPALLHGDLWSGNILADTAGRPVLIDPAVYFGHRSVDLAMTALFGGFEPAFYQAYDWHYPFPPGYRQQWEIANLYPLLVHLNLFGSGYLGQILHIIRRF